MLKQFKWPFVPEKKRLVCGNPVDDFLSEGFSSKVSCLMIEFGETGAALLLKQRGQTGFQKVGLATVKMDSR